MASLPGPPDPVFTLRGSGSPITYLKFSDPSTQQLFSGSEDGTIHIWDLKTHRSKGTLKTSPGQSVLWIKFISSDQFVTFGKDGVAHTYKALDASWEHTGNHTCLTKLYFSIL